MPAVFLPRGPVMCDVRGCTLDEDEREQLRHPLVGGVILFARNFESPAQLQALTADIAALRTPRLLIAVDHEGGRVQRFRDGFTRLPPMASLGRCWEEDPAGALRLAEQTGWVLATELCAHGVELSFTPVLDLGYGQSRVVGDRALHRDPAVVEQLALALVHGLARGGMGAVGKHFPGHGYAEADSHVDIPRDERDFAQIWAEDMRPYRGALGRCLTGVMPAHVIYPACDTQPAGFSRYWLQDVLRARLAYDGCVFSDDLSMEGASVAGGIVARARAASDAGCDMVLVCNRPDLTGTLLRDWQPPLRAASLARIARLHGAGVAEARATLCTPAFLAARDAVRALEAA